MSFWSVLVICCYLFVMLVSVGHFVSSFVDHCLQTVKKMPVATPNPTICSSFILVVGPCCDALEPDASLSKPFIGLKRLLVY